MRDRALNGNTLYEVRRVKLRGVIKTKSNKGQNQDPRGSTGDG
jgi:hypothetical protein